LSAAAAAAFGETAPLELRNAWDKDHGGAETRITFETHA
jgi:hypothetical protein